MTERIDMNKRVDFIVIGARSPVGKAVLEQLSAEGAQAIAFTRGDLPASSETIIWRRLDVLPSLAENDIAHAICVAHIWVIADHIPALRAAGVGRLVALSTTSLFTKRNSNDDHEQEVWRLVEQSETDLRQRCADHGIECTILRPTLIYGNGRDKNVAEIARMIRRTGFFPLFGKAMGKRQPIHAGDVAAAAILAVRSQAAANRSYNISGAEVLTYREMVRRVFLAMGRRPVMPVVPLSLFRLALRVMVTIPRFRHWTPDMAMRMNSDQDFDHRDAARDFGFSPRRFALGPTDVSPV